MACTKAADPGCRQTETDNGDGGADSSQERSFICGVIIESRYHRIAFVSSIALSDPLGFLVRPMKV